MVRRTLKKKPVGSMIEKKHSHERNQHEKGMEGGEVGGGSSAAKKRGRPAGGGAGSGAGGGFGGAGAKKKRIIITPQFGVLDRVLLGVYDDDAKIVGYLLGTVQSIYTTVDGCIYTLILDRDGEEKKDIDEAALFRSVEAV